MSSQEQQYTFKWRHGPAPGLTFYSGTETAYGSDIEIAERRARAAWSHSADASLPAASH